MKLAQELSKGISLLLIFLSLSTCLGSVDKRLLLLFVIRNWGSSGDHGGLEFMLMRIMRVTMNVNPGLEIIQLYGLQRALYCLPVSITLSGALKRGARAPREAPGVLPDAETLLSTTLKISSTRDRGATLVVEVSLSRELRVSMWTLTRGKFMAMIVAAICCYSLVGSKQSRILLSFLT